MARYLLNSVSFSSSSVSFKVVMLATVLGGAGSTEAYGFCDKSEVSSDFNHLILSSAIWHVSATSTISSLMYRSRIVMMMIIIMHIYVIEILKSRTFEFPGLKTITLYRIFYMGSFKYIISRFKISLEFRTFEKIFSNSFPIYFNISYILHY